MNAAAVAPCRFALIGPATALDSMAEPNNHFGLVECMDKGCPVPQSGQGWP